MGRKNNLIFILINLFLINGYYQSIKSNKEISSTSMKENGIFSQIVLGKEISIQDQNISKEENIIFTQSTLDEKDQISSKSISEKQQSDLTLEELEKFRDQGLLSEEDYQTLLEELKAEVNGEMLYSLTVNGKRVSNMFEIHLNNGNLYFPLFKFLENIKFTNYVKEKGNIKLYLGDSLREITFDLNNKKISTPSDKVKERDFNEKIYIENDEVYIEAELFENLFLSLLRINKDHYSLNMSLNFSTNSEINFALDMKKENASNTSSNELIYTNEGKLFELGYLRTAIDKTYERDKGGKSDQDWSGNFEYQGALLYGTGTASYDMKNKKIGNAELEYSEIWKEHTLRLGNYSSMGDAREWGLKFSKEKGYYNSGKNYIIRERVPIGSRVELIYMGFTLDIQDAEEGMVEFNNSEIKSDRTYELKIYTPDGKIYIKEIKTTDDYNQQNKNEFEYDISTQEDHKSKKMKSEINIYYGITDNLTLGTGYYSVPEYVNGKNRYADGGRVELIYSDFINSMSYTLRIGGEKSFKDYVDEFGKDYGKKYKYDYLGQINIDKWKFIISEENYGEFYKEKNRKIYRAEYFPLNYLTLGYEYEKTEDYSGKENKESRFDITMSKSYKSLMTTLSYGKDTNNKGEYNLNFYYTGFDKFSTRLENKWKEDKHGDYVYEAALTLFNNNYKGMLDYTLSAGYSEKYKDKITLSFTFKFDDWFRFKGDADKKGNRKIGVGIDKIIDLQNCKTNIDTMSISRVKAITFLDVNNNNKYDKGEMRVDGVEVQIGNKKGITDKNGEVMFYGVSNSILYDLKPTIKKPSYTLGGNIIKIKGKSASTINAYIPVKPMVTLTGKIEFDEKLSLTEQEKQEIYGDILVKIKDISGREIELTMPDNIGEFDVSGLFPEKYQIELTYLGNRFDLPMLNEIVELAYIDETGNLTLSFVMSDKLISLNNK